MTILLACIQRTGNNQGLSLMISSIDLDLTDGNSAGLDLTYGE